MRKRYSPFGINLPRTLVEVLTVAFMLQFGAAHAAGTGDHMHEDASEKSETGHHDSSMSDDGHGHSDESGSHAHDKWIEPPEEYASLKNPDWADHQSAIRGGKIFLENCASCHGVDGKGTGPVAGSLDHAPADLTNHFHRGPGLGDGYLFWRVTDGGQVEPFKSQDSAMPAFKSVLSESERWDVLTYVHQLFHETDWESHDPDDGHDDSLAHDD